VKTGVEILIVLLWIGTAVGQVPAEDWRPAVTFPNATLPASLRPTEESFTNGRFSEFNAKHVRRFSVLLRNGHVQIRYKPFGWVEVELTGFHDVSAGGAVFGVVEYHMTSIGGSSSNDCFVQVVKFNSGSKPVLAQQIRFGCDSAGSGSKVSADARVLIVREGYKLDSTLNVDRFEWAGSKFSIVGHSTEPVPRKQ